MIAKGTRVLVIEDNPLNMELVHDLLEQLDVCIEGATTAEDGIEIALASPPSLILLDIRLPGMSGMDAVRLLKADARTASVPTVALTAQAMKGDDLEGMDAGFDAYLTKPIDTRAFLQTVARYLTGSEVER